MTCVLAAFNPGSCSLSRVKWGKIDRERERERGHNNFLTFLLLLLVGWRVFSLHLYSTLFCLLNYKNMLAPQLISRFRTFQLIYLYSTLYLILSQKSNTVLLSNQAMSSNWFPASRLHTHRKDVRPVVWKLAEKCAAISGVFFFESVTLARL